MTGVLPAGLGDAVRLAGASLLGLLLPRACVVCGRSLDAGEQALACGRCWSRVAQLPWPRCDRCGHPVGVHRCRWCDALPPFVRAVRSYCWIPGGTGGALVHSLKYGGWPSLAPEMARRLARLSWPADVLEERSALVPVPLAAVRQRERGFNQSALLAGELGRTWQLPVLEDVLVRVRPTRTQTRLTPEERRHNVSGAFRASPGAASLRGAHVVLVDDVITTAATASACAAALLAAGARIISIVTFGRAPAAGDRLASGSA